MPPKSALPHGTTPRPPRRKKATASSKKANHDTNINIDECDYRFGETAPVFTKSTNKVRANDREKENTINTTSADASTTVTKSQSRHHDEAMDSLNESMARVLLTSKYSNNSTTHTLRRIHRIELPVHPLPPEGYGVSITLSDEPRQPPLQTSLTALSSSFDADLHDLFTPPLIHAIEEASYSLRPTPSLLLEENSARLKRFVRTCLQRQHEHERGGQTPHWDWLRVSIHCLRAIHPTFVKDKALGIKLAFHCVVLAAAEGGEEKTKKKGGERQRVVEFGMLQLGAYEVLSRIVDDRCLASWEDMLTTVVDRKEDGGLSYRQMVKICVESGICASSVFLEMGLLGLAGDGTSGVGEVTNVVIPKEFHFVSSVVGACQKAGGPTYQSIVTRAVFPLLLELDVSDAIRHVKKIFRLFWDGARSVETRSGIDDTLRMACLHLQCLAVTILARFACEAFPSSKEEERKELVSLWDRASSSALKMVAVFDKGFDKLKGSKEMKSALLEVHSVAGGMLDNVWIQVYNDARKRSELMISPSSYYEYCAYRYVHQWKLLGSVDTIHSLEQLLRDKDVKYDTDKEDCLAAMASLSVVLLALEARVDMASSEERDSSSTLCEIVISNFDNVVIRNSPSSCQVRCRSMIMLLNLQGEASKIIASQSDSSWNEFSLSTMGYVMGRCIAPLETRLARLSDDPQRCLHLSLSASDNHAKAASFFDCAMKDSANDLKEKWNVECLGQLRMAFELLSPVVEDMEAGEVKSGSPTVLAVEVFAKTASLIGRNRFDSMDMASSIECQVYAVELLTKVASKGSNSGLFEKYQLSNRYTYLASALETNGNKEESCVALALAVWSAAKKNAHASTLLESKDNSFIADTVSEDILLFPGVIILDSQPPSDKITFVDGLAVLVNKLARACIEAFRSQRRENRNIISRDTMFAKSLQAMGSLTNVTSESKSIIKLSRLLDFIVWNCGAFTTSQALVLIRELLKCTAKVLKRTLTDADGCSEEIFSSLVHELNECSCLQVERLKSLVSPEDLRMIQSALHVEFAMYLADSHMLHFPKPHAFLQSNSAVNNAETVLIQHSLDQLQQSEELFSSAAEDSSSIRDFTFFAQWAAVHLQKAILFEHQWMHEQLDINEHGHQAENAVVQQYSATLEICK
eukprot:CCRYP_017836-RA/>CCRYP_017836-RA protein AED:0.02 eAED:0.02 QI:122/1/1/1/0.75/0.8/5/3555/1148